MKISTAFLLSVVLVLAVGCSEQALVGDTASPSPVAAVTSGAPSSVPSASLPAETSSQDYDELGSALMMSEALGDIKLDMTESQLIAALGQPDSQSEATLWGADGMVHSTWTYAAPGLSIDMARDAESSQELTVYTLAAASPCQLTTRRGIGIGDTRQAVLDAYAVEIDPAANADTGDCIIAGSLYGGIQFGIQGDTVSSIFIGAGAE